MKHGPSLTSLTLDDAYLEDSLAAGVAERCRNLQELSIIGCKGILGSGLSSFSRHCTGLRKLKVSLRLVVGESYGKVPINPFCLLQVGGGVWSDSALCGFKDLHSLSIVRRNS